MRQVRIFQPGIYGPGERVVLSESACHHVSVVLRMRENQHLTLFPGDNHEYSAILLSVQKKQVEVLIANKTPMNRESSCGIRLAQGIIKGEGMEWVIQKAVELGVTQIYPLLTQHSSVRHDANFLAKKHAQWQSIVIGACEQSGRNTLPFIHPSCTLSSYLSEKTLPTIRWFLNPYGVDALRSQLHSAQEMTILVGPEGGFHSNEVFQIQQAGFKSLTLGPRILRAETAALAALSVLQARVGDL